MALIWHPFHCMRTFEIIYVNIVVLITTKHDAIVYSSKKSKAYEKCPKILLLF